MNTTLLGVQLFFRHSRAKMSFVNTGPGKMASQRKHRWTTASLLTLQMLSSVCFCFFLECLLTFCSNVSNHLDKTVPMLHAAATLVGFTTPLWYSYNKHFTRNILRSFFLFFFYRNVFSKLKIVCRFVFCASSRLNVPQPLAPAAFLCVLVLTVTAMDSHIPSTSLRCNFCPLQHKGRLVCVSPPLSNWGAVSRTEHSPIKPSPGLKSILNGDYFFFHWKSFSCQN